MPYRGNLTTKLPSPCRTADERPLLDSSLSPAIILSPAVSLRSTSGALGACKWTADLAQVPAHSLCLHANCRPRARGPCVGMLQEVGLVILVACML